MPHPKFTKGNNFSKGRKPLSWCYTLQDIAENRGVKVGAVRKAIERGSLNPADLTSVATYIKKNNNDTGM